jgi:hypothetical protein
MGQLVNNVGKVLTHMSRKAKEALKFIKGKCPGFFDPDVLIRMPIIIIIVPPEYLVEPKEPPPGGYSS